MNRTFRTAGFGAVIVALTAARAAAQGPVAPDGPIAVPVPSVLPAPVIPAAYQAPAGATTSWQPGLTLPPGQPTSVIPPLPGPAPTSGPNPATGTPAATRALPFPRSSTLPSSRTVTNWQPGPTPPGQPTGVTQPPPNPASATGPLPYPSSSPFTPRPPMPPAPPDDAPLLAPRWRDRLVFETPDRDFTLSFGGLFQFDVANYVGPEGLRSTFPGAVPLEDGVAFRRLRLNAAGTIYRNIDYFVELDFVNAFTTVTPGLVAPTDVWVTFRDLPVGNLRVGNQKAPLSLEHLTNDRFLPFLERSVAYDAFVETSNNGFMPGVLLFDTFADCRGTWAVGVFKNTRSFAAYNVGSDEHELDGRVTYLPVDDPAGRALVHVGLGASFRDLDDNRQRFRSRMSVRNSPSELAPTVADTGIIFGNHQGMVIPEVAAVSGPFSFQGEYYASWLSGAELPAGIARVPVGTVFFQGLTAEAHYFLTGESREYDRETGTFGRVVPCSNARWRRGCGLEGLGAWQVALRYSYLDLDNKGIEGGTVHDLTLGLNWFLNPNLKIQWNYSLTYRNVSGTAGDGYMSSFGTRLALDF